MFGPKGETLKDAAALSGKSIGVTRGAVEDMVLSDVAPKDAQVKRYEDNNTTLSAYLSGQVQYVATGNRWSRRLRARTRKSPGAAVYAERFTVLYRPEKNEPALKESERTD